MPSASNGGFLRNCWYVCAFEHELTAHNFISRRILGERVLFYVTRDGQPVALEDRCPHRLVPLSYGRRKDDSIQCGYHGMVFATTGRCIHIPGQAEIPTTAKIRTYPIETRCGYHWIWMGDPSLAAKEEIPDVPWPTLPDWTTVKGYIHMPADYRLVNDNLLDLSHETYVHEGTIGNAPSQSIADFNPTVSVTDGSVQVAREMEGVAPPPWFQMIMNTKDLIDRWQIASWTAPSFNTTTTGGKRRGATKEDGYIGRVLHMLTPETQHSTHYFYSFSRNFRISDKDLNEQLLRALSQTFDEDKQLLALQQLELVESGKTIPTVALRVDNGPLRARRILAARIRREIEGQAASGDLQESTIVEFDT